MSDTDSGKEDSASPLALPNKLEGLNFLLMFFFPHVCIHHKATISELPTTAATDAPQLLVSALLQLPRMALHPL